MKYPAYPAYGERHKQSHLSFPTHWNVQRLRFSVLSNPVRSEVADWDGDTAVSFVPMDAVGELGGMDASQERPIADVYNGYTYFAEQDIVIAKITPCFENGKGAIAQGLKNGVGFGTTEFHVLRPLPGMSNRWLFYLTMSDAFRQIGGAEMLGAGGQKRVPEDFIKNLRTGMPPLDEQEHIAAFLDWKTAQIAALIAKKQDLIEKLKEKRLAVITQAVTKGVDDSAPMRESAVTWIGCVPEHWAVMPAKFLTQILRGQFSHRPRNDANFYDGIYPFVQTGDIARAGKYVTSYSQTLNERGLSVSKLFPAGTLVMTIAANIGDMAIIEFQACFPDSIVGFVPEPDVDLDFMYYMFVAMRQRLMSTAVLNTQLNLNVERIASIKTVKPPIAEQRQIVGYLESVLCGMDKLLSKATSAVTALTEYRTALITAAVTGQIDVRHIAIPEPA